MVGIKIIHDLVDFAFLQFDLHFDEKGPNFLFTDASAAILIKKLESSFEVHDVIFTEAIHEKSMEFIKINIYKYMIISRH